MSRGKEFAKNTLILFIGKFSTQFVSLLLLPLFTHYLLADDYGFVDLLQTYITLFVPILTLRMDSVVFRFLIDKREDEKGKTVIISNVLFVLLCGIIFAISAYVLILLFIKFKYLYYVLFNIVIMMISNVLLQVLRGLGKNKEYSTCSIITGLSNLVINIVMIIFLNYGAESILISSSIANLFVITYITIKARLIKYFDLNEINKEEVKKFLAYSLPMIPNSLSWWVVNVSDRTIISFYLGVAFNGIYTVSCKFSNILNSVFSIFNMSWQESAALHINDDDKEVFFSDMINKLFISFSSVSLLILSVLPLLYDLLIGNEYIDSYFYIPILLYSNSWNIMISLIGGIYIALKKTKEVAGTTIMSAILNIIINILLIKPIGLYAACVSTLCSYLIMSIYRIIDCRKYINIKLNYSSIILFTFIFVLSSVIYYINNVYLNVLNLVFVIVYSVLVNKDILLSILNSVKKKVLR